MDVITYLDNLATESRNAASEKLHEQEQLLAAGVKRQIIHYRYQRGNYVTACQQVPWYVDITYNRAAATCIRCLRTMAKGLGVIGE